MSAHDRFRTPLKRARGLGSAKDGTGHFIVQRVTSIALFFLSFYVIGLIVWLLGGDYASVRATVAHPLHAVLLVSFLIAAFWHAQLGMQVIIEDYVHTAWMAVVLQLAVVFFCILAALATVLAVVRIALAGA